MRGGAGLLSGVAEPQDADAVNRPEVGLRQGRRRGRNIMVEMQKAQEFRVPRPPRDGSAAFRASNLGSDSRRSWRRVAAPAIGVGIQRAAKPALEMPHRICGAIRPRRWVTRFSEVRLPAGEREQRRAVPETLERQRAAQVRTVIKTGSENQRVFEALPSAQKRLGPDTPISMQVSGTNDAAFNRPDARLRLTRWLEPSEENRAARGFHTRKSCFPVTRLRTRFWKACLPERESGKIQPEFWSQGA